MTDLTGNRQKLVDAVFAGLAGTRPSPEMQRFGRIASQTWPVRMAKGAISGVMLPGEVYRGEVDPTSDEAFGRVMELTDLIGTGGLGRIASGGAGLGMFGGRLARTAPLEDLRRAEAMEGMGTSADDIWRSTGWGRGADGQWRFEIDDSEAQFSPQTSDRFAATDVGGHVTSLHGDRFLDHPQLGAAYDDLWRINASLTKGGGYPYRPFARHTVRESGAEGIDINAHNLEAARNLVLHELQHAVQRREGFARGADAINEDLSAFRDQIHAEAVRLHKEEGIPLGDAVALLEARKRADLYGRSSGEVEAINVETRRGMTPEQRRATPPWVTEEIPRSEQIVRR